MKLLAFCHAYVGHGREAGAETTLANLLECLVNEGHECNVLLSRPYDGLSEIYEVNGVGVYPYNDRTTFNALLPAYDAVITHLECSERSNYAAKHLNIPVVHLVHNTMWQTEGYLSEGCDLAVYNTDWVQKFHEAAKTNPVVRVPRDETEKGQRADFRFRAHSEWPSVVVHPQIEPMEYQTPGSGDHVTMVNFFENKGPETFYEMAAAFPDQKFLAVCGGYGEQWLPDLPNVEIVPNTPDMTSVYRRTKVLLMPSQYESFGRVAVEAAASGIPTIASNTPGLREALGPCGLYADPKDISEWRFLLEALLTNQPFYDRMSKVAESRSAYWAAIRPQETKNFIATLAQVVDEFRSKRIG